jgi:ribonuclease P protein component
VDGKSLRNAAKKGATVSRESDAPSLEFTIFVRPNGLDLSRFGWSIKKALGSAVQRNRIRRRLREILRLHRQEIAPGWDIVIHPRSSAATADFSALTRELLQLIPRAPTP